MTELTKSQVDRLGERLRAGEVTAEDLGLLDAYRRSFRPVYTSVAVTLREGTGVPVSGRPSKSRKSITDKLRRESIRLSQMQDIAGCRLVVPGIAAQNQLVERITGLFAHAHVDDRRQRPSHGYHAVHVVVEHAKRHVEVQIRTEIQHTWAELSERMADVIDTGLKYGAGKHKLAIQILASASDLVARVESLEPSIEAQELEISRLGSDIRDLRPYPAELAAELRKTEEGHEVARRSFLETREELREIFLEFIAVLDQWKRG